MPAYQGLAAIIRIILLRIWSEPAPFRDVDARPMPNAFWASNPTAPPGAAFVLGRGTATVETQDAVPEPEATVAELVDPSEEPPAEPEPVDDPDPVDEVALSRLSALQGATVWAAVDRPVFEDPRRQNLLVHRDWAGRIAGVDGG